MKKRLKNKKIKMQEKQLNNLSKKTKQQFIFLSYENYPAYFKIRVESNSLYNEETYSILSDVVNQIPVKLEIYNISKKDQQKLVNGIYSNITYIAEELRDFVEIAQLNKKSDRTFDGRFSNNMLWFQKLLPLVTKKYRFNSISSLYNSIKKLYDLFNDKNFSLQAVYYSDFI